MLIMVLLVPRYFRYLMKHLFNLVENWARIVIFYYSDFVKIEVLKTQCSDKGWYLCGFIICFIKLIQNFETSWKMCKLLKEFLEVFQRKVQSKFVRQCRKRRRSKLGGNRQTLNFSLGQFFLMDSPVDWAEWRLVA